MPPYEEAGKDPNALPFRITESRDDTYLFHLHCDQIRSHAQVSFAEAEKPSKKKVDFERPILVTRYGTPDSPTSEVGSISSIIRKKINLTSKDPRIRLTLKHTTVDLTLYRGGYCGFEVGENEYWWLLRYHASKIMFDTAPARFKDAVLRRNKKGQRPSIAAWYVPHIPSSSSVAPRTTSIAAARTAVSLPDTVPDTPARDSSTAPDLTDGAHLQQEHQASENSSGRQTDECSLPDQNYTPGTSPLDNNEEAAVDREVGTLLLPVDLSSEEQDITLLSFAALLSRVIDIKVCTPFRPSSSSFPGHSVSSSSSVSMSAALRATRAKSANIARSDVWADLATYSPSTVIGRQM